MQLKTQLDHSMALILTFMVIHGTQMGHLEKKRTMAYIPYEFYGEPMVCVKGGS